LSLFEELKRRNVVRVGATYVVLGWVIAQVAEFAFENFGAPDWVLKTVIVLLLLGLPLVLFFAWAFELTPDGLKREKDVDRSESITPQTGRKLDRALIVFLALAVAWFAWDKFLHTDPESTAASSVAAELNGAAEKSIAVLPFIPMSSGPDDEFFADGLTEEILNSLAQLPELLVTARTSAFSFKGQEVPIQEIAAALGVRHIVEGSVRRSGDRLRVTAQLIRAEDGFHLWSKNYDSSSTDAIAVQENIAEQIAAALDVVLDEQKREAMRMAGLRDVEAFIIYQKAYRIYESAHGEIDTLEGLREANVLFEQVIERVPEYSQVYMDHSDLYVHILSDAASGLYTGDESYDAEDALSAAISDYQLAVRHAENAAIRSFAELDLAFIAGNWQGLGGRVEQALAQPGCADGNWTPIIADAFGYSDAAFERSKDLLKCDPRRSLSWFNTARFALKTGDKQEALRLAREGTEIAPGGWLSMMLVKALVANGEFSEALRAIDEGIRDRYSATELKGLVAAVRGDQALADKHLAELLEDGGGGAFWALIANAWTGHREEANRIAAEIDQHHFFGVTLAQIGQWCGCGAPFDLEATPNFAAKLEQAGLNWPPAQTADFPLKDW